MRTQIIEKYGQPGDERNLVIINLPYPMKLAWAPETTVTRMRCHRLLAATFLKIFQEILTHYGQAEISRLRIDRFGGCFENRDVRNGTQKSKHAWGIAIDLDPDNNQLRWGHDRATFAKPEYKPMIDIFYRNGFINLGVEKNFDWMHFEVKL